jgi:hypothetical protein
MRAVVWVTVMVVPLVAMLALPATTLPPVGKLAGSVWAPNGLPAPADSAQAAIKAIAVEQ